MFLRTESERSFIVFLCFPFLKVQEELVEMNWNLLARRRRYAAVAQHADDDTIFQW